MSRRVALSFDFDAMSLWQGSFGATGMGELSRGEFGPIAVARLLELLHRHEVEATFFVPGHTALTYPDSVRAIAAAGHEVGHHGFVHERVSELEPEEERHVMERGFEAIASVVDVTPVGYRSPSWDFTFRTPALLAEFGFQYDSSLMGSDFSLYWLRSGDKAPPDGPYQFGVATSVAEIPVAWLLDDFPHFEYVRGGSGPNAIKTPQQVFDAWWGEFEYFAADPGLDCFTLTMHPQVIGRGSRLEMLDRLIAAMRERTDVRFVRLKTVAAEWKAEQRGPSRA